MGLSKEEVKQIVTVIHLMIKDRSVAAEVARKSNRLPLAQSHLDFVRGLREALDILRSYGVEVEMIVGKKIEIEREDK